MTMLIKKGDYIPDGKGGFLSVSGGEELLQRILFKLTVRRGCFPVLPDLGSELYRLPREKISRQEALAKQYVEEALMDEEDLAITKVFWERDSGRLLVDMIWKTQEISTSLTI